MTPDQAKIVADSFVQLEPRLPELGAAVYDKLFEIAPDARNLFQGDLSAQHQKFFSLLVEFAKVRAKSQHFPPITGNGGRADIPGIENLRSNHDINGVRAEHYAYMREALLSALAAVLGERFEERTADAWAASFDMVAEAMQERDAAQTPEHRELSSLLGRRFEGLSSYASANGGGAGPSMDDFFKIREQPKPFFKR